MKIIIVKDSYQACQIASTMISEEINIKKDLVLGLATGETMIPMYDYLVEAYNNQSVDFSNVTTFNLDEYVGLEKNDQNSYDKYMHDHLFNHVNIQKKNIHLLNGTADDSNQVCRDYDTLIRSSNGIDLQILGIGNNGHIGFNEPANQLKLNTHITHLSEATINQNSRFFPDMTKMPEKALTMGLHPIMSAKKILLLATGSRKADIMATFLCENIISTEVPASILLIHPNLVVIMDEDAAKQYLLRKEDELT